LELGYHAEARAFLHWLLHATHLTWPELRVFYDVFGWMQFDEQHLDDLSGYQHSRPVRIGNRAGHQLQLDVYGEVIGAVHEFVIRGGRLAKRQWRQLRELSGTICKHWQEPDSGIWEIRSAPRHNVHSKVMCWRALDNLLTMHANGHLAVPVDRLRAVHDAIGEVIETEGYSDAVQSYVQAFGNRMPDASLLRLPAQGYIDAAAPRMQSTYIYLKAKLRQNGLWYRYCTDGSDGLPSGEGTFGICSFWATEYLARRGEMDAAKAAFEHVLSYANDVGLFAEEIDAETGAALGNFPQAFTHIGLINAALALAPHHT
jgi:GH15 family glucan-1,4-alpha-glucosidase